MRTIIAVLAAIAAVGCQRSETERALLENIVAADAHAMEANELANLGVIDHARYEAAAQRRDDAIELAAEFLAGR